MKFWCICSDVFIYQRYASAWPNSMNYHNQFVTGSQPTAIDRNEKFASYHFSHRKKTIKEGGKQRAGRSAMAGGKLIMPKKEDDKL